MRVWINKEYDNLYINWEGMEKSDSKIRIEVISKKIRVVNTPDPDSPQLFLNSEIFCETVIQNIDSYKSRYCFNNIAFSSDFRECLLYFKVTEYDDDGDIQTFRDDSFQYPNMLKYDNYPAFIPDHLTNIDRPDVEGGRFTPTYTNRSVELFGEGLSQPVNVNTVLDSHFKVNYFILNGDYIGEYTP